MKSNSNANREQLLLLKKKIRTYEKNTHNLCVFFFSAWLECNVYYISISFWRFLSNNFTGFVSSLILTIFVGGVHVVVFFFPRLSSLQHVYTYIFYIYVVLLCSLSLLAVLLGKRRDFSLQIIRFSFSFLTCTLSYSPAEHYYYIPKLKLYFLRFCWHLRCVVIYIYKKFI